MKLLTLLIAMSLTGFIHGQSSHANPEALLKDKEQEQERADSICAVRGHIYEVSMDSSAYYIQHVIDSSGIGMINLTNIPSFLKVGNWIETEQHSLDSFKVYVDTPDSTFIAWRYKQVALFCYRCHRFITQPPVNDRYIKTTWTKL